MSRFDAARVLVLDSPRARLRELPLQEACAHAGLDAGTAALAQHQVPLLTAALRERGAAAVLVAASAPAVGGCWYWLDGRHARGWIAPERHETLNLLQQAWEANLLEGHVPVDAALLLWPTPPRLSWGNEPVPEDGAPTADAPMTEAPLGLYAIVDSATALRRVLDAGVRTVQLRIKQPADADAAWGAALRTAVYDSILAADDHGALLFINDHWRLAAEVGAAAVHLGQEDLLALGDQGRAEFRATGLTMGVSSHSVWELCRARSLAPRYVACGPVWPTTTKAMPWRPQGVDNLAWWCSVAGASVVAIGGILTADQVRQAAACGASGVCVLRGLGSDPRLTVATLQKAFDEGHQEVLNEAHRPVPRLHPTLDAAA